MNSLQSEILCKLSFCVVWYLWDKIQFFPVRRKKTASTYPHLSLVIIYPNVFSKNKFYFFSPNSFWNTQVWMHCRKDRKIQAFWRSIENRRSYSIFLQYLQMYKNYKQHIQMVWFYWTTDIRKVRDVNAFSKRTS